MKTKNSRFAMVTMLSLLILAGCAREVQRELPAVAEPIKGDEVIGYLDAFDEREAQSGIMNVALAGQGIATENTYYRIKQAIQYDDLFCVHITIITKGELGDGFIVGFLDADLEGVRLVAKSFDTTLEDDRRHYEVHYQLAIQSDAFSEESLRALGFTRDYAGSDWVITERTRFSL